MSSGSSLSRDDGDRAEILEDGSSIGELKRNNFNRLGSIIEDVEVNYDDDEDMYEPM